MKRALFLSPHLDDVVFSCGATLALWLQHGWEALVVTVFTGNTASPRGFALQCQTSKGIPPEVDYMALRRAEDKMALAHLGQSSLLHWEFLEAPHRGYNSPPDLFAGVKEGDAVWHPITESLRHWEDLDGSLGFDAVFAPQGLGNHVDHLHVIHALRSFPPERVHWYRDTPYAIREPEANYSPLLPPDLVTRSVTFDQKILDQKIAACCAYASQIGFQFGGAQGVGDKLTAFHRAEAETQNTDPYAELFLQAPDAPPLFEL